MVRTLSLCALLAAWPCLGLAQEKPATVVPPVRLTIHPMAAPTPALKYQLLPEVKEMNPGNAVQGFMKSFMAHETFFFSKPSQADQEKWRTAPLEELRANSAKLQEYGGSALTQADYAARLDLVDWQILLRARSEGYDLILPDVQYLRGLAVALRVRFRIEVAEGRFDDAIGTAKTNLALARSFSDYPGIITSFSGLAIAFIQLESLEEMIQQPGCPNLYWALTTLPSPLVDNRKNLQGEAMFGAREFRNINAESPISADSLEKIKSRLSQRIGGPLAAKEKQKLTAWMESRVADKEYVQAARARLVAAGTVADRVKELSPLQVVLVDEKREFEVRIDEGRKWLALPFWQAEAGLKAATPSRQGDHMIAEVFLPNFTRVRLAQLRGERAIAVMRQVESLRMYAAAHDGKFPAGLEDLSVPVPIDPIHGKPFDYKLEGDSAVLRASSPVGFEAAASLHYIVTIKK
jgi:hypothetical protein